MGGRPGGRGAGEPGGCRVQVRDGRGLGGGWSGVSRWRRGGHRSGLSAAGKSPMTEKTWGEKVYMR
ncbi:hypothetical protein TIFTF001_014602 [Ficus carica]|uniref:Uncharacterized protein n=1 Tax=Ficus carica TaxID=3494 RepID=A0AA88D4A2_FICCA|nr:hypothetical protein TIFTF001_014602 [Ficus carica]